MPKYLDETGLTRFYDNIADRPVYAFDTVAEMQAATYLEDGMTCHTNGFHASGDGGAAYYTVSASGTANGMDVLALQGGLYATLVVTEPYVTPEQFGAVMNSSADASANNNAIARIIALGLPMVVNDGTLYVSSAITFGSSGSTLDCIGTIKYVGSASASDYLITTANGGSAAGDIVPVGKRYSFKVDCGGLINGINWAGGRSNAVSAFVKDPYSIGVYMPSGYGYENSFEDITVYNFQSRVEGRDYVGVRVNKSDEVIHKVSTRNMTYSVKLDGTANYVGSVHAWCAGDEWLPDSAAVACNASKNTIEYVYQDSVQYGLLILSGFAYVEVGKIEMYMNTGLFSADVLAANPMRAWKVGFEFAAGTKPVYRINSIVPTSYSSVDASRIVCERGDGFVVIGDGSRLQINGGSVVDVPNGEFFVRTGVLTDLPTGVTINRGHLTKYNSLNYAFIEFADMEIYASGTNNNPNIYYITINQSTLVVQSSRVVTATKN